MAPTLGLEPRTPWLTVKCSNQLSYVGTTGVDLKKNKDLPGNVLSSLLRTIFGAEVLNFCVRDGNRCVHFAIVTRHLSKLDIFCHLIKSIDLLVLVSFKCHHSSTPSLSTLWSTRDLMGKSHLKVGFTLRCFQRLSIPYLATQLWSWQTNWYTIGMSTPVFSY